MAGLEKEMARRALRAALDRLAAEPAGDGRQAHSCGCDQSQRGSDGAVVLVVLGQASSPGDEQAGVRGEADPSVVRVSAARAGGQVASHPGLEKFSLREGERDASAAKACFMEPDRACVNSGACEMRGY